MPVPCHTPCTICGDVECVLSRPNKFGEKTLSYGEAEKFLREHPRSDFDFKSAVLKALKGGEKK